MDRLFLDANVLFSAAYREDAGLVERWKLEDVELVTSAYAFEEARRNLSDDEQIERLQALVRWLSIVPESDVELPSNVKIQEKDQPILQAAIASKASHLITGIVDATSENRSRVSGSCLRANISIRKRRDAPIT